MRLAARSRADKHIDGRSATEPLAAPIQFAGLLGRRGRIRHASDAARGMRGDDCARSYRRSIHFH